MQISQLNEKYKVLTVESTKVVIKLKEYFIHIMFFTYSPNIVKNDSMSFEFNNPFNSK